MVHLGVAAASRYASHLRAAASPRWKSGSTSIGFVLMLGIASHQSVVLSDVVVCDCRRFPCCDLEAERRAPHGDKNDYGRGTIMVAMLKLLLIVEPAND